MVDLREIRANRIGITFQNPLKRDPFRFVSSGLLLWMLYGITRPIATVQKKKLQEVLKAGGAPVPTPAAGRGEPWGNDDPNTNAPAKGASARVWPRRRYE
jgi:hypothetical protein